MNIFTGACKSNFSVSKKKKLQLLPYNIINWNEDLNTDQYYNQPLQKIWFSVLKYLLKEPYVMLKIAKEKFNEESTKQANTFKTCKSWDILPQQTSTWNPGFQIFGKAHTHHEDIPIFVHNLHFSKLCLTWKHKFTYLGTSVNSLEVRTLDMPLYVIHKAFFNCVLSWPCFLKNIIK